MAKLFIGTSRVRAASLAALALTAGLGLAACSSDQGGTPSTPSAKAPTSPSAAASSAAASEIGKPITVGNFTYTFESVKSVGKTLSTDEGESMAQGEFVVVTMKVTNNSGSAQNVTASDFTAVTAGNQAVEAQENDSVIANGTNPAFREGIGAGKSAEVKLVFDFSPTLKTPVTQMLIKEPGSTKTVTVRLA